MSSAMEALREALRTSPEAARARREQARPGIGPWTVVQGGLAGWVGMTALMQVARRLGLSSISMIELEGSFFAPPRSAKAESIGFFTHLGMSLWIAFVYAAGFKVLRLRPGWKAGLFGSVIHWLIAAVVVGWWSKINPYRRQLSVPGFGGFAQGPMGAFGFVVAHAVYGTLFGWRYGIASGVASGKSDQALRHGR